MKTNLKDNIWIEGFEYPLDYQKEYIIKVIGYENIIYSGKTSEIPEELAKEYFDYGYDSLELHFISLNEAIQSACSKPYCIIYKTK